MFERMTGEEILELDYGDDDDAKIGFSCDNCHELYTLS